MTVKELRKLLKKFSGHLRVFVDDVQNVGLFEPVHARKAYLDQHGTVHPKRTEAGRRPEKVVQIF